MKIREFLSHKKFIAVVAVLILLFFLQLTSSFYIIEGPIDLMMQPVGKVTHKFGIFVAEQFDWFKKKKDLIREIETLRAEVNNLLSEKANTQLLEEENKILKKQLNFFDNQTFTYQLANVVGNIQNKNFQGLKIDKGEKDGIEKGMAVIQEEGIVIGKIAEVSKYSSIVLLVIDNNTQLAASINNLNRTTGIVTGVYNLSLKMDYIPKTENISIGDIVITSGLEEKIPRGLVIGTIKEIITEPNDLFQKAIIKQHVDYNKLSIVTVIK